MSEKSEPDMAPTSKPLPPLSAFLHTPESIPYSSSPSIIHLKRDLLVPLSFQSNDTEGPETHDARAAAYSSKGVLNTRFGDFPHSSIVGIPYGSQVRAAPATNNEQNRKRKRKEDAGGAATAEPVSSGFLHVLAPTAELWTASLPHRTQVVYTPDSSFILHKLQVRPGSVLIEAGAGSGSFTHAGARAVYNGYPDGRSGVGKEEGRRGKVFSFEFHKERVQKLTDEIGRHGLDGLVEIVHRDVCKAGFLLKRKADELEEERDVSPGATAVFLDLPAPWLALPHLTRQTCPTPSLPTSTGLTPSPSPGPSASAEKIGESTATVTAIIPLQDLLDPSSSAKVSIKTEDGTITILDDKVSNETFDSAKPSALSSTETVRICTFSPCIEQVTRTVSVLRKLGWVDIEMVEVQHRRVEVRRQNPKGYEDGAGPRTVGEAVQRLKWVGEYREHKRERDMADTTSTRQNPTEAWKTQNSREKKGAKDGKIVTRIEPEIKSHTSYLVFAVLPREWTAEDEAAAQALVNQTTKGVVNAPVDGDLKGNGKLRWGGEKEEKLLSKRQIKKAERGKRKAEERRVKAEEAMEDESAPAANEEVGEDIPSADDGNDDMEVDG
ncbi:GCD14-domain-containing protein [Choiromyces venosus 120613-1]|uniref:tRNA (adenine(58)-N(1))-methyltransferase catalytic subunit TRM61 n=1 Tax=Choiromyces venosus 120613-1 TaxID=1336337 RepID=A0A3N4K0I7_9PEZI|nr:GCD14-domain-containing protein [Choiromyces venosus 120613-1]